MTCVEEDVTTLLHTHHEHIVCPPVCLSVSPYTQLLSVLKAAYWTSASPECPAIADSTC